MDAKLAALLLPNETASIAPAVGTGRFGRYAIVLRSAADAQGVGVFWDESHALTLGQQIASMRKHLR